MKKIIVITLFLLLTGCDYTELNDLSIINRIGLNYTDNEYELYAEIIDEIDKENNPQTKIITTKNKTIKECFQQLIILSNKSIHYSHIELLILSTNLNNNNLQEIFNYFLSNNSFRNDFTIISSNSIDNLLKNSKFDEIEELVSNNAHNEIINIDIETIIKKYYDKKQFTVSLFDYEKEKVTYKYNVVYQNNKVERINNE